MTVINISMEKLIFQGRHNDFELVCEEDHHNFELEKLSGRMIKGSEVKCIDCGSGAIVFDDGGIYKLMDADENISLEIV